MLSLPIRTSTVTTPKRYGLYFLAIVRLPSSIKLIHKIIANKHDSLLEYGTSITIGLRSLARKMGMAYAKSVLRLQDLHARKLLSGVNHKYIL